MLAYLVLFIVLLAPVVLVAAIEALCRWLDWGS